MIVQRRKDLHLRDPSGRPAPGGTEPIPACHRPAGCIGMGTVEDASAIIYQRLEILAVRPIGAGDDPHPYAFHREYIVVCSLLDESLFVGQPDLMVPAGDLALRPDDDLRVPAFAAGVL